MPAIPRAVKSRTEPKPRTKPAEVRREELLDAAERLFLEKGLAATSVDEIVSRADVAKGTFYLHFASKDALVVGLRERFLRRFHEGVEKAIARKRPDDYRGRLRAWIQASVDSFMDQYELHEIVFHEFRPEEHKKGADNEVFSSLIELLKAGTAAGVFELSDPELTAMMLLHSFHGAADAILAAEKTGARKSVVKQIEVFALRVVGGAP